MSISEVRGRSSIRRRLAAGLVVSVTLSMGAACVPRASFSPGSAALLTMSPTLMKCIADQHLDGLANDRPPTLQEVARVVTAARTCGFGAPRGYVEQLAEHAAEAPAVPPPPPGSSEWPNVANSVIKCIADQHLDGLTIDTPPTELNRLRVVAAARACGLVIPVGYAE